MKNIYKSLAIAVLLFITAKGAAQNQLDWFSFKKDYFPGIYDPFGKYLSGTELMRLTSHKGKLYASTSTFLDSFFVERYSYYTGAQILRKDSSDGKWHADLTLGVEYLRADCLESIEFTYDSTGTKLSKPVKILIAGIWDVAYSRQRMVSVAVRLDDENRWVISSIDTNTSNDQGSVRSMIVHRDKITGIQYLFIGAGVGSIYKGIYDPSQDTKIRWVGKNELDFDAGRVQSMTICNDTLYAAFGYGDSQSPEDEGGLYKRIDGENPKWELVYSWENNPNGKFEYLLRGISTVEDPENPNNQVIVGALEKPPLPVIRMINPSKGYAVTEEINYEDYFTTIFGAKPNPKQYMNAAILNKLEPFVNPETGQNEHLVTTFIMHPQSPSKAYNGAYYMVRHNDMSYDWGAIYDTINLPDGIELQGVRTIEKSPFADEPNVYYFGGYAADYENVKNTAWIYKGTLNKSLGSTENSFAKSIVQYPNPAQNQLTISNLPSSFKGLVSIFNSMGQLIQSEQKSGSQFIIQTSHLITGVYIVQIRNENGGIITKKFIKE